MSGLHKTMKRSFQSSFKVAGASKETQTGRSDPSANERSDLTQTLHWYEKLPKFCCKKINKSYLTHLASLITETAKVYLMEMSVLSARLSAYRDLMEFDLLIAIRLFAV